MVANTFQIQVKLNHRLKLLTLGINESLSVTHKKENFGFGGRLSFWVWRYCSEKVTKGK